MRRSTAQLPWVTAVAILVAGTSYATDFPQRPGAGSSIGVGAASIVGTVRYDGEPPDPAVFSMIQDASCIAAHGGETILSNRLVVNDNGTLRWVFVYVREAITGSLPMNSGMKPYSIRSSGITC